MGTLRGSYCCGASVALSQGLQGLTGLIFNLLGLSNGLGSSIAHAKKILY